MRREVHAKVWSWLQGNFPTEAAGTSSAAAAAGELDTALELLKCSDTKNELVSSPGEPGQELSPQRGLPGESTAVCCILPGQTLCPRACMHVLGHMHKLYECLGMHASLLADFASCSKGLLCLSLTNRLSQNLQMSLRC